MIGHKRCGGKGSILLSGFKGRRSHGVRKPTGERKVFYFGGKKL